MTWQLQDGVLGTLAHEEEVLSQRLRPSEFRAAQCKIPKSPEYRQQLRGIPDVLAQLVRACIGYFDLGGSIAPGSTQRLAEGNLHAELLLGALRGVWDGPEHLQPLAEVCDRL